MRSVFLVGALVAALGLPVAPASAQTGSKGGTSLGSVTLNKKVMADGKPLAPGTYQLRLTGDGPAPAVGASPDAEKYVEFLRGGKVVAREVATVISNEDVKTIAKGPKPAANGARVDTLKGNDYVRVWINRGNTNYFIHLPAST